jgi:enoyl-CoA hydratase/carnithine racemase
MTDSVTTEVQDKVAHVRLNRPEKNNAVNLAMFEELIAAGERIAADSGIRAVVLSGAGKNFCSGIDVSLFAASEPQQLMQMMAPQEPSPANLFQRAAFVWKEVPVPVLCAIHGVAFGAGLQIALGADLRYATPDAQLSVMEIKWGLVPDMAISAVARHCVRLDTLCELAWTGRIVTAGEAAGIGLVTSVQEDPLAYASNAADVIAGRSPDAVRAMKQLFQQAWQLPVREALALEAKLQMGLMGKANQREAVAANIERREPRFDD